MKIIVSRNQLEQKMACFSWQAFDRPQNNGTNNFIPFTYRNSSVWLRYCDATSMKNKDHVSLKRVDEGWITTVNIFKNGTFKRWPLVWEHQLVSKIPSRFSPGACFSKVPRTFRARKASCQTAIHLLDKADLLTCFKCAKFDGSEPWRREDI